MHYFQPSDRYSNSHRIVCNECISGCIYLIKEKKKSIRKRTFLIYLKARSVSCLKPAFMKSLYERGDKCLAELSINLDIFPSPINSWRHIRKNIKENTLKQIEVFLTIQQIHVCLLRTQVKWLSTSNFLLRILFTEIY